MADTPETPDAAGEGAPAEPVVTPLKRYLLKSVVREAHNRTSRAQVPGRRPLVTRLLGGTILVRRGKPVVVTETLLMANLAEIRRAVDTHQIAVTTFDDREVDLDTFEAAPAEPSRVQPHPLLDSAKNDKNEGIGYKVPPTPEGTTSDQPAPELLTRSSVHEVEPIADADRAASIPPSLPPPALSDPVRTDELQLPSLSRPLDKKGKHRGKG